MALPVFTNRRYYNAGRIISKYSVDGLVFDKLDTVHHLMQKKDRKALRREFQGSFSNDSNELETLWLEHYQEWDLKVVI